MAIITAAGLSDLYNQRIFNKNGSTVTLKKISEKDWILFGDLAEGDSEGFGGLEPSGFVIKTTDGVVAVIEGPGTVPGTDVYVEADGYIDGHNSLEEVISWPEEKPDWLEGDGILFPDAVYLTKVPDSLPAWITDMTYMFEGCSSFNQDLSGWDTSNVTNMGFMFNRCSSFNQDLSEWNTSNVTDMSFMFYECSNFNQDLSGWCVSNFSGEPFNFSYNTTSWTLPKPIWGTCP